jgi:signal transduction histidine kinase
MLGKTVAEISPSTDVESNRFMLERLQKLGYARYEHLPLQTKAGRRVAVEFVCNKNHTGDRDVIQCNVRYIAERKEAEERREEFNHKLQVLSRRLVEAQESERRHIARELHDEIGQSLTVIQLNLQALLQSPGQRTPASRLKESLEVVDHVLEQVQDIALNLRPLILDDLGLEPALRWFTAQQAALIGLQIRFHADPLEQRLNPVIETECFRVAQEALTNVVRHAGAKTVSVELRKETGKLHLRVHDDGIGFDVGAVREQALRGASLGLLSMEERAALAGGGLEYKSAPKQGTEVHAWFPLKWKTPSLESKRP